MEARCKSLETIIIKLCDPIEQSNKRDIWKSLATLAIKRIIELVNLTRVRNIHY
jgi:hypothetical protein